MDCDQGVPLDEAFGSSATTAFDRFVSNCAASYDQGVTVCGKKYFCREQTPDGRDPQYFWDNNPASAFAHSDKCSADVLAAAANANNCSTVSLPCVSATCLVRNPFMDNGQSQIQVRGDKTTQMPSILEANWKCTSPLSERDYTPAKLEQFGAEGLWVVKLTPVGSSQSAPPTGTPAIPMKVKWDAPVEDQTPVVITPWSNTWQASNGSDGGTSGEWGDAMPSNVWQSSLGESAATPGVVAATPGVVAATPGVGATTPSVVAAVPDVVAATPGVVAVPDVVAATPNVAAVPNVVAATPGVATGAAVAEAGAAPASLYSIPNGTWQSNVGTGSGNSLPDTTWQSNVGTGSGNSLPDTTWQSVAGGNTTGTTGSSESQWKECFLPPPRRPNQACEDDADCFSEEMYKDLLVRMLDSSKTDVTNALTFLKDQISPEIAWSPSGVEKVAAESQKTFAGTKQGLVALFDTDDTFRGSVQKVIQTEQFLQDRQTRTQGKCVARGGNGTKSCSNIKVVPSRHLVDAGKEATFQLDETQQKVWITRNGRTVEVEAKNCTASETLKELCASVPALEPNADDVVQITKDAAFQQTYRLSFDSGDFLVKNTISSNTEKCAERICAHNSEACPSSLCQKLDGKCVPHA